MNDWMAGQHTPVVGLALDREEVIVQPVVPEPKSLLGGQSTSCCILNVATQRGTHCLLWLWLFMSATIVIGHPSERSGMINA